MKNLQEEIIRQIDLSKQLDEEGLKECIDREILKNTVAKSLDLETKCRRRKEIFYAMRRLGIVQELIADSEPLPYSWKKTEGLRCCRLDLTRQRSWNR